MDVERLFKIRDMLYELNEDISERLGEIDRQVMLLNQQTVKTECPKCGREITTTITEDPNVLEEYFNQERKYEVNCPDCGQAVEVILPKVDYKDEGR